MGPDTVDYTVKCILLGEASVGKTSIVQVLRCNELIGPPYPTIGLEFHAQYYSFPGTSQPGRDSTEYRVQVWDCAGQERYRSIVRGYVRGSKLAVLVYDVTNRATFDALRDWITLLNMLPRDAHVWLVGNKTDLAHEPPTDEDVAELTAAIKATVQADCFVRHVTVSCKSPTKVRDMLSEMVNQLHLSVERGTVLLQHSSAFHTETVTLEEDVTALPQCGKC